MRVEEQAVQRRVAAGELDRALPEDLAEQRRRTDAVSDVEQLLGALGQTRMRAAAQGLVADGLAAAEDHDALKVHRDELIAQQHVQLPGSLHELLGKREVAHHGRRLGARRDRLFETELEVREMDHVSVLQDLVRHAVAIHEGAVRALRDPGRAAHRRARRTPRVRSRPTCWGASGPGPARRPTRKGRWLTETFQTRLPPSISDLSTHGVGT